MRDRIFQELSQAKFNTVYTSLYSDYKRKKVKQYNKVIIIISAIGGVLGSIIPDQYGKGTAIIFCFLITVISILKEIMPKYFNENEIHNIDKILSFYTKYHEKIEQLWYEFENNRISDSKATKQFYNIKETEENINELVNSIMVEKPQFLVEQATKITTDFINRVYIKNA